jgi:hypothetical protein
LPGKTREERIRHATAKGGLDSLFPGFEDAGGDADWRCVESDNPFTRLYLDYRCFSAASSDAVRVVERHYRLLSDFWNEKVAQLRTGSTATKLADKFGPGLKDFPKRVIEAYESLDSAEKIRLEHRRIEDARLDRGRQPILETLPLAVTDGVLEPEEARRLAAFGVKAGLSAREAAEVIVGWLADNRYQTLAQPPQGSTPEERLEYRWLSPEERRKVVEKRVLDSLQSRVGDGVLTPQEVLNVVQVGVGAGLTEEETAFIVLTWLKQAGWRPSGGAFRAITLRGKRLSYEWRSPDKTGRRLWKVILPVTLVLTIGALAVVVWTWVARPEPPPAPTVSVSASTDAVRLGESVKITAQLAGFETASLVFRWETTAGKIVGTTDEVWLDTSQISRRRAPSHVTVTTSVQDNLGHTAQDEIVLRIDWKQASVAATRTAPAAVAQEAQPNGISTTPPETLAPPSESTHSEAVSIVEARQFVESYLAAVNRSSPEDLVQFYAEPAEYYREKQATHEFIREDKRRYYRRWPDVLFTLTGDLTASELLGSSDLVVKFPTQFRVRSQQHGDTVNGSAENTMRLRKDNGRLLIVSVSERILYQQKTYDQRRIPIPRPGVPSVFSTRRAR